MKETTQYAPVLIPTLCRYDHFKRCVESLSRCKGAEKTDIYIGIDFPANESHEEGWKKIVDYVETIDGFNSVNIYVREFNFGVSSNIKDLRNRVYQDFDRYIFSEDDNEFSPNFLLYMNQCLDRYKNDESIIRVCGHAFSEWEKIEKYKNNAYPYLGYSSWGVGVWKNKDISSFVNADSAFKLLKSWKNTKKLLVGGKYLILHRLFHRYKNSFGDLMVCAYCTINSKYCIFPKVSKVRNLGFDGSGLNCSVNENYQKQMIDESTEFELDTFDIKDYKEIKNVCNRRYELNWFKRRFVEFEYLFFRLTGNSITELRKKIK